MNGKRMNGTQDIKDLGILWSKKAPSRIQDREISLYCHPAGAFCSTELHLTDTAMRHDGERSYPAQGSGQMARNSAILGQTPGRRSSLSCLINSREDLRPGYSQYMYLDNEEKCSVSDVLLDLALISASRTFNSGQSPSNPVRRGTRSLPVISIASPVGRTRTLTSGTLRKVPECMRAEHPAREMYPMNMTFTTRSTNTSGAMIPLLYLNSCLQAP